MRKIATTLLTLAVSFATVLGGATAATAAPALTEFMPEYGYDGTVTGGFLYFSEDVPSSTQIYLTVSACGRVLHTQTFNGVVKVDSVSGDGVLYIQGFQKIIDKSMAGPAIEASVSFSDPTLPPSSATGYTHNGYPRSCDALEPADDNGGGGSTITVTKWSDKKGNTTAKVGKTLKVTPTRAAPGTKIVYMWKVGTKTVDRDRTMTVKKAYMGRKVTMRVTVSKAGAKSVSKTLRYGTAR